MEGVSLMTDFLLAAILIALLFQIHAKEKNVGKYGRLCVFLEKRCLRCLIKQGRVNYQKVKDKIKEVKYGAKG